ncbi:MAG: hypothetical protein DRQ55_10740 [Planctomycetota bacterium]|nr:MAG: hypothetical protein DRQ55_10740 [Planctomycetota bacterium]
MGMTEIATTACDDITRAMRGDRAAFGRLVTAHHGAALALAPSSSTLAQLGRALLRTPPR